MGPAGPAGPEGVDILEGGRPEDWHPRRRRILRWTAGLAALAVAVVSVGLTFAQSDDGQNGLGRNQVAATDLRVGDCAQVPLGLNQLPSAVDQKKCGTKHNAEVFLVGALPAGSFPGTANLQAQVDALCLRGVEPFLGGDPRGRSLLMLDFVPDPGAWALGQRDYQCLLADPAHDLTSTLKGSLAGSTDGAV